MPLNSTRSNPNYQVSAARRRALFARPQALPPEQQGFVDEQLVPQMNPAIKVAEGNPRNFGVLSEQVSSPDEANSVLNNSIGNNYKRWIQAGSPGKFVDFMADRWAPIGAENDPTNLNKNWTPNVRGALQGQLGDEEYEKWKRLNLARQRVMRSPNYNPNQSAQEVNSIGAESSSLLS